MKISNAHYLIIDLEATCTNDGSFPRTEMEIIEIGAVVMDARLFQIESEFQTFIKPIRQPTLTPFCTELTTITQDMVDDGPPFADAMAALTAWMSQFDDLLFCSWGNYDRNQFHQDCNYHNVAYPFGKHHMNVKEQFSTATNQRKRFGIGGALKRLGLTFEGTAHRGLDDARNIARIIQHVCVGG